MPKAKVDAKFFVEGRDAYVARVPMLQLVQRAVDIGEDADDDGTAVASYFIGALDGLVSDIRLLADVARRL